MFSHITLGTNDLESAIAFYDSALKPLGIKRVFTEYDHGLAGYAPADQPPQLFICKPYDEKPASVGNGTHIALLAPNRMAVAACHKAAVAAGGKNEGAPGPRMQYHEHYYGAYMRDLDGNKLQACCHDPED